ncbi:hypothetical protein [Neoroseomonas soli]|uniref:Uncharacterized protein n=1 Tax=Neoroseomonas soli TaxID=1081025 RepID=A0A9X9WYK0_9PROT|nr:hypothetical protein [Neoroseomonas soli]MBR0672229.1 hypothetical protein [Neoroseomonas soli]
MHPLHDALAGEFAAAAQDWPAECRAEAEWLLATMRIDVLAALAGACRLAGLSQARRAEAITAILAITTRWRVIEARYPGAEKDAVRDEAKRILRGLAEALPQIPAPRIGIARILSVEGNPDAALEALEGAGPGGRNLASEYLLILTRALADRHGARMLHRALNVPEWIVAAAKEDWRIFLLHRAVTLGTIAAQQRLRDGYLEADPAYGAALALVTTADRDVEARCRDLIAEVRALPPREEATALWRTIREPLLLYSMLEDAERARILLLDETMRLAEATAGTEGFDFQTISCAHTLLPCCERLWTDAAFRRERAAALAGLLRRIDHPRRDLFLGYFAFMMEDYAAAKDAFAVATKTSPHAIGASTYIDFRSVPAILHAAGEDATPAPAFTVLSPRPAVRNGPLVAISANDRYLRRHAVHYAQQLRRRSREGNLHVHLIGDPEAEQETLQSLARILPGYRVTLTSEPVTVNEPYYFATARMLRMAQLCRIAPARPLLVTDIDSTLREPAADFVARKLGTADVGLALRSQVTVGHHWRVAGLANVYPRAVPWQTVAAWAIAIAPTAGGRRFAEILSRVAAEGLRRAAADASGPRWMIDQNILFAAYAHAVTFRPGIRFADVGSPLDLPPSELPEDVPPPRGRHWIAAD